MEPANSEALSAGARQLGVPLAAEQLAAFAAYLDLLLAWNRKINLTRITDPAGVVEKHFLDSLAVAPEVATARSLVDVGAGAGFPGLVLALVCPGLRVTAVESIGKKAAFLEAVKRRLGLSNVTVFAGRMEELIARGERFEVAVSRATFAPEEWVVRGAELVAPGGKLVAMVVPNAAGGVDWLPALDAALRARFEGVHVGPTYAPGRALLVLTGRRST